MRFLTCGSVDDGKSTLMGRLLYDAGLVFEDQLASLVGSARGGDGTDQEIDFALLFDGLEAEREQGITIDVAHRYFATPRRAFIVADAPGHEQYTRNMATAASNAEVAVLLVDARKGMLAQTRRHAYICTLLGIRHIALAINKIDLIDDPRAVFDEIVADFTAFSGKLGDIDVTPIPLSARYGDNVARRSARTSWFFGPTLIEYLETIDVAGRLDERPLRFPVQLVNRPNLDVRGLSGTIASGRVRVGDEVVVASSARMSRLARILGPDGECDEAEAGAAVTLVLADDIDISRGDMLSHGTDGPVLSDQFAAHLLWMADEPLMPGRSYLLRVGTAWIPAIVTLIKHKVDVDSLQAIASRSLGRNDIAQCNVATARPVAFDPYAENRATGGFILVDRYTNQTAAAGMIDFALRRANNIGIEHLALDRDARALLMGQRSSVLWFTGLSGAGKSTIAREVERRLYGLGRRTYMLDGDNLRHGLNRDLGFTPADRVENIRRVGEVARLMSDAGLIVLCSFISPFRAERQAVRELFEPGEFLELFVDAPLELCMERDPKGLYAKVRAGVLPNFTGVDSPYERPEQAELTLNTLRHDVATLVDRVIDELHARGLLEPVL